MRPALAVAAAAVLAGILLLALRSRPSNPDPAVPVAPAGDTDATPLAAAERAGPPLPGPGEPAMPGPGALPAAAAIATDASLADAALPDLTLPEPTAPQVAATWHLSNAGIAFQAQDFEVAFAQAELTLRAMPDRSAARRIAALSACALGWHQDAQRHAEKLERSRFEEVQTACALDGVELRSPYAPWP